jgi:hypothetical protein
MSARRSDSGRIAKSGGGFVGVLSSTDYPLTSGTVRNITFNQEISSFMIQNRNTTSGLLYCMFPDGETPTTPMIIDYGSSVTIQKAWATSVQIYADEDALAWQIVYTI